MYVVMPFLYAVDSTEHCHHRMHSLHQGLPHDEDTEAESRGGGELCPEVVWCQHPGGVPSGSAPVLPYCGNIGQPCPFSWLLQAVPTMVTLQAML